uniref:Fungal lipase-type domain-containing protein n=1 Tax=Skeletonema marinoi TaxID=267567 RepID=A0A7S2PS01_9STRA|mmetsp:Transcript_29418/g.50153  ORF Transcript_29418/g.50153 Transcript_29418/m.50153 type:complete len:500 (+) Transcript_29418:113-1612(+)
MTENQKHKTSEKDVVDSFERRIHNAFKELDDLEDSSSMSSTAANAGLLRKCKIKMFGSKKKKQETGEKDIVSGFEERFHNVVRGLEDVSVLSKCSAAAASTHTDDSGETEADEKLELGFIKYLPSSDMTNGIEEYYVRLCAIISSCMYLPQPLVHILEKQGCKLASIFLKEPPNVLLFDDHGIFETTNPPFSVTVAGKKMILAWRGSMSVMDWVRDFGFYVASSFRWKNVADVVSVQGAYLACVESCMAKHQDFILKMINKYHVTEILLTGHSLAGGVAQVAHLWFTGTMDPSIDPQPNPWKDLKNKVGLTVRTMSFEGPMTTVFMRSDDDQLNQKGIDFINKCSANMCTTCYKMDVVPRMYGYVDFGLSMVENALHNATHNEEGIIIGIIEKDLVGRELESVLYLAKAYYTIARKLHLKNDITVAMQFQHLGHIIYYDSSEAKPQVLVDNPNGILTDAEGKTSPLPQFRDIKYVPTDDILDQLKDHIYILFGIGLSRN